MATGIQGDLQTLNTEAVITTVFVEFASQNLAPFSCEMIAKRA